MIENVHKQIPFLFYIPAQGSATQEDFGIGAVEREKKKNAFTTWLFYLSESQMFFQLERLN